MPLYISESRQRRKRKSVPVSAGTAEEKADAVWCMTCATSGKSDLDFERFCKTGALRWDRCGLQAV